MNNQLVVFARETLKTDLQQCTEGQQSLFRRMYAFGKDELTLDEVVDSMPEEKLDWAMQQVERTLEKSKVQKGK
jgi:hypothetical protein